MKCIGAYNVRNPNRPNYYVTRKNGVKFYNPTTASRRRIVRLMRSLSRERHGRITIAIIE